jgi:hypothetical protein
VTRIHTLEIVVGQHQRELDVSQSANESALLRLAERLALLHDDHYRLRETISGLPSRVDIHDLELRLGERMDSLAHDSTALSTHIIPDDATRSHGPTLEPRGGRLAIYAEALLQSASKL